MQLYQFALSRWVAGICGLSNRPAHAVRLKTHLISQRLSLTMPRLNQNQRIQALTMLARGDNVSKPGNPFGQRGPMWDKCLKHRHRAARLQWAQRHFRLGRQQWARVLFSNESRFNLSHHDGGIRIFIRRGERFADNCLIERTDLEVGVLWYGVALWAEGKQISLLCKASSMLKVTLIRFCSLKLFLSFKGMGLQY